MNVSSIQPLREDLCDASSAFSASLKTSLFSLEDKLQIFKILPKSSDNIQKVDTVYGKVYKGSTLANKNQPEKTTDIVIDTNKTICPEFDLPKLTCGYSHVLSIDETETYLSCNVSPKLSKESKKLTRNQSRSEDWKKLRKFRLTSSKSFK